MRSPHIRVTILGAFDVRDGDDVLPLVESARAQSLFTYLLVHREAPQPRQHIAFLLWPDSTEAQARTNLRHVLHNLRRALPQPQWFLDASPHALRWKPDAPFSLDLAGFEQSLVRADAPDVAGGGVAALREAVELYGGDLLEGCHDEWLLEPRERLRQQYLVALLEEKATPPRPSSTRGSCCGKIRCTRVRTGR